MIERDFFHLLHLFHLRAFLHENKESTKISDYIPRATDGRRCPASLRRPCSAKAPLRILWLVSFFVAPRIYQAQSPGRDPRVVVMSLSRRIEHSDSTFAGIDLSPSKSFRSLRNTPLTFAAGRARYDNLPDLSWILATWLSLSRARKSTSRSRCEEKNDMIRTNRACADPRECSTRAALQRVIPLLSRFREIPVGIGAVEGGRDAKSLYARTPNPTREREKDRETYTRRNGREERGCEMRISRTKEKTGEKDRKRERVETLSGRGNIIR